MKKHLFLLLLTLSGAVISAHGQDRVALKTNLLYGVYTFTPNLGAEIGMGHRTTLELSGGYNGWNLNGSNVDNYKLVHWLGQAEFRYWLCQRFNGHFFGVHLLGSEYNISGHNLPLLLGSGSGNYRYEGWAAGGGISYGYQLVLGRRWNVEFNIGVGYARLRYDRYDCVKCGRKEGTHSRNYYGPTKAAISLIFIIK